MLPDCQIILFCDAIEGRIILRRCVCNRPVFGALAIQLIFGVARVNVNGSSVVVGVRFRVSNTRLQGRTATRKLCTRE